MSYIAVGFLVTLILSLLAAPLTGAAQPRSTVSRIGILTPAVEASTPLWEASARAARPGLCGGAEHRPCEDRGFVAVFPERRFLFDPGQGTTICCKPVYLEMRIDQYLAPLAEVLYRVGLDVGMCLLQAVKVALLIRLPLLFENLDVLMRFPFIWAEEQEISFPRTLGIGDNDVCRDGRFHDEFSFATAEVWTTLDV